MKISVFHGGFANLNSDETLVGWDEFVDLVSTPEIGIKNGRYFVRGFCDGPRCDESMKTLDLIIVDGDQLLSDGGSCCPAQPVHDVMAAENITHVIYNSYSNDLVNNRHKWRLCVPCEDLIDEEALIMGVTEIVSLLHSHGLPVRNVHENLTLSQPWFTPRCPEHAIDDFYAAWHDGDRYRIGRRVILESAGVYSGNAEDMDGAHSDKGGQFSWDVVFKDFQRGTIHMGLKSAAGWLVKTTDWADSQIKTHLTALVSSLCPDKAKVHRAETVEIEQLIKYCRKKSGVAIDLPSADWKAKAITAEELRDKEFPPVQWAVDGVIPEGLCVFAGDPKVGKSLVAVDICSAIASGVKAFGNRTCVAGGAVYVSLEDPERRVKARIATQCDRWPASFRLVTGGIPTVGDDFFKTLNEMMMIWPDTRCIVFDTLSYIVPTKPNGKSDYEHYYKFLGPIHDWAMENQVAVVVITHTNKGQAISGENVFSKIMGSQAISGCADSMLLLQKNHAKTNPKDPTIADGFLHLQGRELGQDCIALDFDQEEMRWTISGEVKGDEATGNTRWLEIIDVLKRYGSMGPTDLSSAVGYNVATTKTCLRRMKAKGLVSNSDGKWSVCGFEGACVEW